MDKEKQVSIYFAWVVEIESARVWYVHDYVIMHISMKEHKSIVFLNAQSLFLREKAAEGGERVIWLFCFQ